MKFEHIIDLCKRQSRKRVPVIINAQDEDVMHAVFRALNIGIIAHPILIGDSAKILAILKRHSHNEEHFTILDIADGKEASDKGVELVISGEGDFLMKGRVDTSVILKAILDKKEDLAPEHLENDGGLFFSHVAIAEVATLERLIIIADCAMNIAPDAKTKAKIVENAYLVANKLGMDKPKIALLAAKEKVSPKMPATLDAQTLCKEYAKDTRFDIAGPLALDNALSKRSADIKGIQGPIQGDADILIVPNIEAGNILYKALTCLCSDTQMAGILVGAKVPVVLTSRADDMNTKFYSILLASIF